MKLLVVDDQTAAGAWVDWTVDALTEAGFEVQRVVSAAEASEVFKKSVQEFNALVLDMTLNARKTGLDLAREARDLGYKHPIILVTGNPRSLDTPIKDLAAVSAGGLTTVYIKNEGPPFVQYVKELLR